MGFSKMMELLQQKEKDKIVICNMGNFYVSIGRDAVLLHELLGLKVSCFKKEICKVGFPIISLEKYTDEIEIKNYSYIVYYFDQEKEELKILKKYDGKKINEIDRQNINCYICTKNIGRYKKEDKYIRAVANLYEKEKIKEKTIKESEKKRKIWFANKTKKTNLY